MIGSHHDAGLRLQVTKDYAAMSTAAAGVILEELRHNPALVLCVSAGGSPTGTYEVLAEHYASRPALFRRMRILQIDEWGGLPAHGPGTCLADLEQKVLGPLQIPRERCHLFRSDAADPERECQSAARWLARNGPIDICILGLGLNGHIAMNEPAEALIPHPHAAKLAPRSLHHPMLGKSGPRPRYGLTLGLGDILRSRKILLLVSGTKKRAILKRMLKPRVSPRLPASFLWLHPDAAVICDRAAVGTTK
jgi:galactosamine-6-phosphate isomerase